MAWPQGCVFHTSDESSLWAMRTFNFILLHSSINRASCKHCVLLGNIDVNIRKTSEESYPRYLFIHIHSIAISIKRFEELLRRASSWSESLQETRSGEKPLPIRNRLYEHRLSLLSLRVSAVTHVSVIFNIPSWRQSSYGEPITSYKTLLYVTPREPNRLTL